MTKEALIDYMKRHKLNAKTLAYYLGVTQGAVLHWVGGRRDIPKLVERVIDYFDDVGESLEELVPPDER